MVLEDASQDHELRTKDTTRTPMDGSTSSKLSIDKSLWLLPLELQQQTLGFLDLNSIKAFCLVNWRAWHVGIGFVWRDVKLVDCRSRYQVPDEYKPWRESVAGLNDEPGARYDPMEGQDEHDDTPIVRKLLVLAR